MLGRTDKVKGRLEAGALDDHTRLKRRSILEKDTRSIFAKADWLRSREDVDFPVLDEVMEAGWARRGTPAACVGASV